MRKQFLSLVLAVAALMLININQADAQRLSLTANMNLFANGEQIEDLEDLELNLTEQRGYSLNLRMYDKSRWALRLGVGTNKLTYSVEDGSNIEEVIRENLTGFVGLEKHVKLAFLYPYAGVYVPITFNTKDVLGTAQNSIKNGDVSAGFSVLAGANIQMFKILRVGAEFNVGFSRFKSEIFDNLVSNNTDAISLNRLDYNTEITVGLAF